MRTGRTYLDYSAVNVVGIVSLASPAGSKVASLDGLGSWVSKFVVDPLRVPDFIAFRLSESPGRIVIQKIIKEAIESKSLPSLKFIPINDFTG